MNKFYNFIFLYIFYILYFYIFFIFLYIYIFIFLYIYIFIYLYKISNLIAVSSASHATHYTEHVVILNIYIDYRAIGNTGRSIHIKGGIINA